MNLYKVFCADEWCLFVFAPTRNVARYQLAKVELEPYSVRYDLYMDARAYKVGESDKINEITVVDCEKHPAYPIVQELGEGYAAPDDWDVRDDPQMKSSEKMESDKYLFVGYRTTPAMQSMMISGEPWDELIARIRQEEKEVKNV